MSVIKEYVEARMEASDFVRDVFEAVTDTGDPYERTYEICLRTDILLQDSLDIHDADEEPNEGRKLVVYGKKGGVYIAEYRKGADGVGRYWTHGKVIEPAEWRYL